MERSRTQKDIIEQQSTRKEKLRSPAEIHARYVRSVAQYRQIMTGREDQREQRIMLFNEVRALGWVLGKSEQTINQDLKP